MNILLYRPVQLDPLDLQHFDFLDPWGKNQPETANKNLFLSKPKSKLKKEIKSSLISEWFIKFSRHKQKNTKIF